MGKGKWYGGGRGGGGNNSTSSVRGHGAILGTCESARGREASKELVNLLTQTIEMMEVPMSESSSSAPSSGVQLSAKDELEAELAEIRQKSHKATQQVISVDTNIKGVILVKIMNRNIDPVTLVQRVFERIKNEGLPCSRYIARLIPLQRVFYPNKNELRQNIGEMLRKEFPGADFPPVVTEEEELGNADSSNNNDNNDNNDDKDKALLDGPEKEKESTCKRDATTLDEDKSPQVQEGDGEDTLVAKKQRLENGDAVSADPPTFVQYPSHTYVLQFRKRNHDVLNKDEVTSSLMATSPKFLHSNWKYYEVSIFFSLSFNCKFETKHAPSRCISWA